MTTRERCNPGFQRPFTPRHYPTDAELVAQQAEKGRRYREIQERGRQGLQARLQAEVDGARAIEAREAEAVAESPMGQEAIEEMVKEATK